MSPMDDAFMSYFTKPYDDMSGNVSARLAEIEAEKKRMRDERSALEQFSTEDSGRAFGSAFLPFLAGVFGGDGDINTGLQYGSQAGLGELGTIQTEHAKRQALLDTDIGLLDKESSTRRDFMDRIMLQGANDKSELGLKYLTGEVPGTEPFNTEQGALNERNMAFLKGTGRIPAGSGPGGGKYTELDDNADAMMRQTYNLPPKGPGESNMTYADVDLLDRGQDNNRLSIGADNKAAAADNSSFENTLDGYVPIPGLSIPKKIDKFRETEGFRRPAIDSLDKLEALMKERAARGDSKVALWGDDAQLNELLAKPALAWARAYMGTGASLTGKGRMGEVSQLAAFAPAGSDDIPDSAYENLTRYVKGQDPAVFVKNLKDQINSLTLGRGRAFNMYAPEMQDYYDPSDIQHINDLAASNQLDSPWGKYADVLAAMKRGGRSARIQTPIPGATPTGTPMPTATPTPMPMATVPGATPTPNKYEDPAYKAWKLQKGIK